MKILHVVPLTSASAAYGGPTGGTRRQALQQVQQFRARVAVLSLTDGQDKGSSCDSGVRNIRFKSRIVPIGSRFGGLFSLSAIVWFARSVRHFDIIHFHSGRELWVLVIQVLARALRVPYVVQTHGMLAPRRRPLVRIYDAVLTKWAVGGARSVFYLTDFEARSLRTWKWMPRLAKIVNGVEQVNSRALLDGSGETLNIVTVARLHPRKRIPDLVRAVALLRGEGFDLSLMIYGPDEGDLANILQGVRLSGATEYIKYGGALEYGAVRRKLERYTVFVLPSVAEPFPNSLLEALATGLLCVATSECGLSPYLARSKAGIVVESGPLGIASGIRVISKMTDDERADMVRRSAELCTSEFSMEAVVARIAEEYDWALS